jgi:hypothetical protein
MFQNGTKSVNSEPKISMFSPFGRIAGRTRSSGKTVTGDGTWDFQYYPQAKLKVSNGKVHRFPKAKSCPF